MHFIEHLIVDDYDGISCLSVCDIDDDGNLDFFSCKYRTDQVSYWLNNGEQHFTEYNIADYLDRVLNVFAVDMDEDEDMDVVVGRSAYGVDMDNVLSWFENNGDQEFTLRDISAIDDTTDRLQTCIAIDIDNDDDIDVLGTNSGGEELSCIALWINDGNQNFERLTLSRRWSVRLFGEDIDGDEDFDIIATKCGHWPYSYSQVSWFEDTGNYTYNEHIIQDNIRDIIFIDIADIDGDEDTDIVGVIRDQHENIVWWENDEDQGFDSHIIYGPIEEATSLYAGDMDYNGDMDVVTSGRIGYPGTGYIYWWENDSEEDFYGHLVTDSLIGFYNLDLVDLDGDDDLDILGWSHDVDEAIIWWENRPNQYAPSEFELFQPDDESYVLFENCSEITFDWEESVDLDIPDDSSQVVKYDLHLAIFQPDSSIDSISYLSLDNTQFTTNLIDFLDLKPGRISIQVTWWVNAISLQDTTECESRFIFTLVPENGIYNYSSDVIPSKFCIASTYPNPFNSRINIRISLPHPSQLSVCIFNLLGQQMQVLANEHYEAGYRSFTFNANGLAEGIYFIYAEIPGEMKDMRKVVLLK
ncbi:MAG: FG-GAP-like repeat-containing protein [Candidatus Electryonea clarkiae]|nr:FG-GAP-like repeat-containing protein [Candidatus Electryonea clarkiae]MDP8288574.1 FG-GAP-like repeat-containing protein [Candidatus Electryonea clarkiae]